MASGWCTGHRHGYEIRLYPGDESDSSKSDEEIVHVNECGEPIADEAFASAEK